VKATGFTPSAEGAFAKSTLIEDSGVKATGFTPSAEGAFAKSTLKEKQTRPKLKQT
jgi:hypothetical protein